MKGEMGTFGDPPNVAVIVTRSVVYEQDWIAFVSHDYEDGAWQFHGSQSNPMQETDALVASSQSIVQLDDSVRDLSDLPVGWHAWRTTREMPWLRAETET
ncbi:hypothetical protein [Paraburkholderia bannensis]|uniref:hypothetical protein n=1 Tax=Paraburkholderia bannensis TaxID=765414 RepID=UPI0004825539|nr:hypothetical protein [Paraburkholderia bannensis]